MLTKIEVEKLSFDDLDAKQTNKKTRVSEEQLQKSINKLLDTANQIYMLVKKMYQKQSKPSSPNSSPLR